MPTNCIRLYTNNSLAMFFSNTIHKLIPNFTITISPCSNYPFNTKTIKNKCTILIPTSHATKFFSRLNSDKIVNLNANFLDLIYSIALRNPIHIPPLPNLNISTTQLSLIFESSQAYNTF